MLQTTMMLVALILIIGSVYGALTHGVNAMTFTEVAEKVTGSGYSNVFNFSDWSSSTNFFKCFLSGIFIVIVMTGLDQDMMQKNLTCKTLHDARKDMCTYGFAFVPVNALFLLLGILLTLYYAREGMPLPEKPDALLSTYVMTSSQTLSLLTYAAFMIGIVSTSFSTVDSALTALTTTVCVDLLGHDGKTGGHIQRGVVHLAVALLLAACCILFHYFNTTSLIDAVYKLVSYTYGPLLGLFAYALMEKREDTAETVWLSRIGGESFICIASPLVCLALDIYVPKIIGYHFGYELLMLNGILTFLGLSLLRKPTFTLFRLKK